MPNTLNLKDAGERQWDVVVVGGALSGAATAMEILRRRPQTQLLIIESGESHDRRVGESTVEVSTFFLERVLGLRSELNRNHIVKQGLRFFFRNERTTRLHDCSECGPKFNTLFPGYQVDRSRLDEVVLGKACERGAHLLRPAKVKQVILEPQGLQQAITQSGDHAASIRARWLVDASGVRGLVARQEGWMRSNDEHPIATAWTRWEGVTDWDAPEVMDECSRYSNRVYGVRNNATNHLMGKGWWAWWIPLKNGDVSIGVVYDQRLHELPPGERIADRLLAMLRSHPAGERLLRRATFKQGDVHFRRNCAYYSETFATDGATLVGDAAGFIDPFYSPGMDWITYTAMASAKLIAEHLESGQTSACPKRLATHNAQFADSYDRWFRAIYKDKYYYMGDYELMRLAFRLDLGFYYLGVVARPFLLGADSLTVPSFGQKEGKWPAIIIRHYNRRLAAIAKRRLSAGRWGRYNDRRSYGFFSYRLNYTLPLRLMAATASYFWLECKELFANGFRHVKESDHPPTPLAATKSKPASAP